MAIPLSVRGLDAFHEPYREEVTTENISCHGCTYRMKHEVLPGATVVLSVGESKGDCGAAGRARVKWMQVFGSGNGQGCEVAVEFDNAGNIWGLASPPEDWFPVREGKVEESSNTGQELQVVTDTESQIVPTESQIVPTPSAPSASLSKKNVIAGAVIPSFSEVLAGLGDQIQVNLAETATAILYSEKGRLLEALRLQLQEDATQAIERMVTTRKEELVRRVLGEMIEAQEATTRTNHERWVKTIEQDIGDARQRMLIQGNEVSQRIVTRLREQVTPLLEDAKAELQKLVVSQQAFKEDSQAIYTRVAKELETNVNAKLAKAHAELNENSAAVVGECNTKLAELSRAFEKATRDSLPSLVASATDDARKVLEERTAEMSNNFTDQLEGHIRSYLEFIGDSIAEIPKKTLLR